MLYIIMAASLLGWDIIMAYIQLWAHSYIAWRMLKLLADSRVDQGPIVIWDGGQSLDVHNNSPPLYGHSSYTYS